MPDTPDTPLPPAAPGPLRARDRFDRDLLTLRRRLTREAQTATSMLDAAIAALRALDPDAARAVRSIDDTVDAEEVAIEAECFRLLSLQQPVGEDFRRIAFCIKANQDVERIADHATSIAKAAVRLHEAGASTAWPLALTDLMDRVPQTAHRLLRIVLDEDTAAARELIDSDEVIDRLDKQLFREVEDLIQRTPSRTTEGLLIYRVGRELERAADLLAAMAEDVVYLVEGTIVRHAKRLRRAV